MDLNSNNLVHESVEDNASTVHVDFSKIAINGSSMNVVSAKDVSVNGSLPDDNREKSFRNPEQVNIELVRAKSPGGSWPSATKGFGLKKWRRINREGLMKEGTVNVDSSKVLKRGLFGSVNPPSKPVSSSVEAKQCSEGSVGSVHMVNNKGIADGFSLDLDSRVVTGQAFSDVELENCEEYSSKSSAMAMASTRNIPFLQNLGGKITAGSSSRQKSRVDTAKKARGYQVKNEEVNLCSSLESDSRSANFVFSNSTFSVADNGEYTYGACESDWRLNKDVQNGYRRENRKHETEDGTQDHHCRAEKDPLVDSIRNLAAVQEALEKEVQDLREIGRESMLLPHDDEPSSSNLSGAENSKENNSTSTESLEMILKQHIKHLESKLEEAKSMFKARDSRIQELENSKVEYELVDLFQRRMEAEIEHLMLTTYLKTHGVLEEQKRTQTTGKAETEMTGDSKHNLGDISGKACKFGSCFLMQLILLIFVLGFFILRFSPRSQAIMPT